MIEPSYRYRATVISVYDGDTLTLDIDLGCHVRIRERIRLARVNTPELRGGTVDTKLAGLEARDFVRKILPEGASVIVATNKDKQGKYGRYIGEIWYSLSLSDHVTISANLGDALLESGHAVKYQG